MNQIKINNISQHSMKKYALYNAQSNVKGFLCKGKVQK